MNKLCFLIFLVSSFGFSQSLEEGIYVATETFISNQNEKSFHLLIQQESTFKNQVKTIDEQLAFIFLLCNKAYYLKNIRSIEAIMTYEDAWSRYTKHKLSRLSDYDIIENCLKPLGNLYIKNGDFTNAENIIKQYIYLAEKSKNTKHQVAGAINLSKLYQTLGKHETVISITNKALKITAIGYVQKQKLISIRGDSQISRNNIDNESNILNAINSETFEYHKKSAQIELQNKKYKLALVHFMKAKALFFKQKDLLGRAVAKLYFEEAQIHFLLKNTKQTLKSLQEATKTLLPNFNTMGLPKKKDLYAENTFIDIFDLWALLQPNSAQSISFYDLSTHVSSLLYTNLTSQKSKIENVARQRIRSEKCIELLYFEYSKTKNTSSFVDALSYAESTKALVLKGVVNQKSLLSQYPLDTLLINEQKLLQQQEQVTNRLINEQLGDAKSTAVFNLSKQLNDISIELKTIKKDILKKHPHVENSILNLTKLQQNLQQDRATIVEYFYGKHTIYQFIITPKSTIFNKINLTNSTKNEITAFNNLFEDASIINNNISNFTKHAYSIYNLLHFSEALTTKNVIIIPDGLLNFVPFEALLTSKTTSINYTEMPFVIYQQVLLYNSSITSYLKENTPLLKPKVLGIFPVFEGTNKKLTYSIDEAKYIESEITSTIFFNEKATKSNFIENVSNYNSLHLSTHASAGSYTKPASIQFFEGSMTLNDLYSLNLNTDLVVLSACETGVGVLYKSEGAMSIARGFQYAGAKNLLFSLWQINDLSTSQIMQSFYKYYNKYQSPYLANYNSKIDYLKNPSISNIKKSPYYWSAFVFYGSLSPIQTDHTFFYVLFGVLVLLITVFLAKKLKRHERDTSRISS